MAQPDKMSDKMPDKPEDLAAQVARLQAQVDALMGDRVAPDLTGFVGRAEAAMADAGGALREEASAICEHVRQKPLISLAIAAGIGWIIGRAMR
jgi:ElaB/YqjD/DUF883 family membrane-anchored ribosome-binding protein